MTEGLRAEFPSAFRVFATVPGPRIAPASVPWAVVAALGAQLLVTAIAELLVVLISPVLFPARGARLITFSSTVLWESAGAVAAGAVVARAGGLRATLGYIVFQLAVLALTIPVRVFGCSRTSANQGPGPCDFLTLTWASVVNRWPFWVALAAGVALALLVPLRSGGSNRILLAAGALSACIAIAAGLSSLWFVYRPSYFGGSDALNVYLSVGALEWIGLVAGAALAGRMLVRSPLAAVVLLALAVIGPSFAMGFPLIRGQTGLPLVMPGPMYLQMWSWAWTPVAASVAMFAAREVARRSRPRSGEPAA